MQSGRKSLAPVVEENLKYVEIYEELNKLKKEAGDIQKAVGYARVAVAIRNCPVLLTSMKQINQLKKDPDTKHQVEGIGKSVGQVRNWV